MGLTDIGGGGGTERYFADVFATYDRAISGAYELLLIIDNQSLAQLKAVSRHLVGERILHFDGSVTSLRGIQALYRLCSAARIALLHIPLPSRRYLPFLWFLRLGLGPWRPHVTVTMPDCSVSHTWYEPWSCRSLGEVKAWVLHRLCFHTVRLDGVLTWYERFVDQVQRPAIHDRPIVVPAAYCFVDNERFRPVRNKDRLIVFAARLTRVKRPILFLDGLEQAVDRAPELFEGWHIAVYGRGPLEMEVARRIATSPLQGRVTLRSSPSMASVFARSSVFVSTQDYDNFTSLSMLEAMASGNSVIARDVGQTPLFVRHEENGLLFKDDTPESLAETLIAYLSHPERHGAMEAESRRIAVEEYNARNALAELDHFWRGVLERFGNCSSSSRWSI